MICFFKNLLSCCDRIPLTCLVRWIIHKHMTMYVYKRQISFKNKLKNGWNWWWVKWETN